MQGSMAIILKLEVLKFDIEMKSSRLKIFQVKVQTYAKMQKFKSNKVFQKLLNKKFH